MNKIPKKQDQILGYTPIWIADDQLAYNSAQKDRFGQLLQSDLLMNAEKFIRDKVDEKG